MQRIAESRLFGLAVSSVLLAGILFNNCAVLMKPLEPAVSEAVSSSIEGMLVHTTCSAFASALLVEATCRQLDSLYASPTQLRRLQDSSVTVAFRDIRLLIKQKKTETPYSAKSASVLFLSDSAAAESSSDATRRSETLSFSFRGPNNTVSVSRFPAEFDLPGVVDSLGCYHLMDSGSVKSRWRVEFKDTRVEAQDFNLDSAGPIEIEATYHMLVSERSAGTSRQLIVWEGCVHGFGRPGAWLYHSDSLRVFDCRKLLKLKPRT